MIAPIQAVTKILVQQDAVVEMLWKAVDPYHELSTRSIPVTVVQPVSNAPMTEETEEDCLVFVPHYSLQKVHWKPLNLNKQWQYHFWQLPKWHTTLQWGTVFRHSLHEERYH